jgi:hypothetical protein
VPVEPRPPAPHRSRGWRARAGALLVTAFIAYHVTVLLVVNLPLRGPTRGLHWVFSRYAGMTAYLETIGGYQHWDFFSPNPPRVNRYVRVLVQDGDGGVTDVRHDSHGRQTYPYLRYDHVRKVNRRLGEDPHYQPGYAAWVCRDWERTHGGRPATEVRLLELSTRIPPPSAGYAGMRYDARALPVEEREIARYPCATLPHARLPDALRHRFGLPASAE